MKAYTIRGIDGRLYKTLQTQARGAGKSLNRYLLGLIEAGAGGGARAPMRNLDKFFGIYSAADARRAKAAMASLRTIDHEMWK